MSKKKFALSSDFVNVSPEKPVQTTPTYTPEVQRSIPNKTLPYTGPNTNRVKFSSSIDATLRNEFKIWVAQQGSDISSELENAIKIIMKKN